jgi:peptide/nickel transport system permease protein
MIPFILKRLGLAVIVAFAVSILSFMLVRLSGDPAIAIAGEGARESTSRPSGPPTGSIARRSSSTSTGSGACSPGTFGTSYYFKSDVAALVLDKLPVTLQLGLLSLAFALVSRCRWAWLRPCARTAGSTGSRSPSRCSARRCRTSSSP